MYLIIGTIAFFFLTLFLHDYIVSVLFGFNSCSFICFLEPLNYTYFDFMCLSSTTYLFIHFTYSFISAFSEFITYYNYLLESFFFFYEPQNFLFDGISYMRNSSLVGIILIIWLSYHKFFFLLKYRFLFLKYILISLLFICYFSIFFFLISYIFYLLQNVDFYDFKTVFEYDSWFDPFFYDHNSDYSFLLLVENTLTLFWIFFFFFSLTLILIFFYACRLLLSYMLFFFSRNFISLLNLSRPHIFLIFLSYFALFLLSLSLQLAIFYFVLPFFLIFEGSRFISWLFIVYGQTKSSYQPQNNPI